MELLDIPGVAEVVSSATQDIPSDADDVVSSATHVLVTQINTVVSSATHVIMFGCR